MDFLGRIAGRFSLQEPLAEVSDDADVSFHAGFIGKRLYDDSLPVHARCA